MPASARTVAGSPSGCTGNAAARHPPGPGFLADPGGPVGPGPGWAGSAGVPGAAGSAAPRTRTRGRSRSRDHGLLDRRRPDLGRPELAAWGRWRHAAWGRWQHAAWGRWQHAAWGRWQHAAWGRWQHAAWGRWQHAEAGGAGDARGPGRRQPRDGRSVPLSPVPCRLRDTPGEERRKRGDKPGMPICHFPADRTGRDRAGQGLWRTPRPRVAAKAPRVTQATPVPRSA